MSRGEHGLLHECSMERCFPRRTSTSLAELKGRFGRAGGQASQGGRHHALLHGRRVAGLLPGGHMKSLQG